MKILFDEQNTGLLQRFRNIVCLFPQLKTIINKATFQPTLKISQRTAYTSQKLWGKKFQLLKNFFLLTGNKREMTVSRAVGLEGFF